VDQREHAADHELRRQWRETFARSRLRAPLIDGTPQNLEHARARLDAHGPMSGRVGEHERCHLRLVFGERQQRDERRPETLRPTALGFVRRLDDSRHLGERVL
jgi:hypothetical protein